MNLYKVIVTSSSEESVLSGLAWEVAHRIIPVVEAGLLGLGAVRTESKVKGKVEEPLLGQIPVTHSTDTWELAGRVVEVSLVEYQESPEEPEQ